MDSETAERLGEIFAKKAQLAENDKYAAQGKPAEQKIRGEITAYRWCISLMKDLEDSDTNEVLEDLEGRLNQDL